MKVNVEIDCTPDEARRFFGLPEVAPMQERLMAEVEARMMRGITETDPQRLMENWLPLTVKGLESWQTLWSQMAAAAGGYGPGAGRDRKKG
ncbi:MAG TPA: DUF6489 family protein [Geminicoccaceae bacterium]|nr:DUF6489 family protein [Geminicoccaceae bacterium]